jgi:hypothetical protein
MHSEVANESTTSRQAADLDRRLHDVAWGSLLIITGIIWLVPDNQVPDSAWLWGVAGVLLGVNVVRYLKHVQVNGFSMALGLAAFMAAVTQIWRQDLPLVAICLIVIGASLLAKPLLTRTA